jgi:F420-dependent oxidoreductase-like protein
VPLSFGVGLSPQRPFEEVARAWQDAEDLGFDSAWVYDHFMGIPNTDDPYLEGWTLLTTLLMRSSRIRGGNLVLGNSYRHPAVLANMAATLDIACGGRLDVGIGAGWYEAEYDAYGIPFPRIGVRMAQLDEALQVMKRLWMDERANFEGEHYVLIDAPCEPKPLQRPHPPVWVGGEGEKLLLRIVARHAHGWNVWLMPVEDYRRKVEVLAGHCRDAGRDPATIARSLGIALAVAPTEQEVGEELKRREGKREPRFVVSGTPEQVAAQLQPYVDLGARTIIIEGIAAFNREMLALFKREVAPALME